MKTILITIAVFFGMNVTAQVEGMEMYVPSDEFYPELDKAYLYEKDEFAFSLVDKKGYDGKVNLTDYKAVRTEMLRIFEVNGFDQIPEGVIMSGQKGKFITNEDFVNEIRKEDAYLMIRYKMGEYYLYINLNDEFCGLSVTKELTLVE